jgi:hypothetical protein
VLQRRLPTRAEKSGSSHCRGLRAGRKRRGSENDDEQPRDLPDTRGRDRGQGGRMIYFSRNERDLGIDGIHVASPFLPPGQARSAMRAEPWLDGTGDGIRPAIPSRCDYCATVAPTTKLGATRIVARFEASRGARQDECLSRFAPVVRPAQSRPASMIAVARRAGSEKHSSWLPDTCTRRNSPSFSDSRGCQG